MHTHFVTVIKQKFSSLLTCVFLMFLGATDAELRMTRQECTNEKDPDPHHIFNPSNTQ